MFGSDRLYQLDCQPWQIELYQSTTPFEFKVEGDGPVPELSTEMFSPFIGKANDLKASMNAVEAAKLTTAWLSECVSAHEGCGGDESSVLPKRVIHVGSEDVNPRLIETIDGQRGRYVTLSYCWGRSISFITTTANNDHCQFHHPLDGIFNFGASEDDRRRGTLLSSHEDRLSLG